MEAPERGSRITPLPPPQPEGEIGSPERVSRPWAPALAGLAGLFVFALWLIGAQGGGEPTPDPDAGTSPAAAPLSAPDLSEPPATSIPTTTTARRPLADDLPWLQGSLVMFGRSFGAGGTTVWRGGDTTPIRFDYSSSNVATVKPEPVGVTFIAYETDGPTPALHVGGWQRQDSIFVGSRGFAWDPAGSATLAWVGTDQITDETSLYTLDPETGISLVAPMPPGTRLVEWTQAGLIMSEERGPPVTVRDDSTGSTTLRTPALTVLRAPDGTEIATAVAEPLRASRSGTVIAVGTSEVFAAANLVAPHDTALWVPDDFVALDSPTGGISGFEVRRLAPLPELTDEAELFSPDGRWSLSQDGNWVGRVSNRDSVATLVVFGLRTGEIRAETIVGEGPASTVGFTPDGTRFVAWRGLTDELIVVTWLNGDQTTVPFANDAWMAGVYIGP